jgi:hypothetical protein
MSVDVGVRLDLNNKGFIAGVGESAAAWKALRSEIQRQNAAFQAHNRQVAATRGEYSKLQSTIRGTSDATHLLSLNFYELRSAMRNTVTRAALTGFSSVAAAIDSLATSATTAVFSLGNLGGALALGGAGGLAAGIQGIAVAALGLNGILKALTTTGHAHDLAMRKLDKTARDFEKSLTPLRLEFQTIKVLSQKGIFPGLEDAVKRIHPLFKIFNQTVYDTGRNMGYLADRAAQMLANRDGQIKKILDNQGKLIQHYGRSIENFGSGFLDIWQSAMPLMDHVAGKVEKFSQSFETSMRNWRKDGSLGKFFDNFKESFDNWGTILGGFGKTFFNIWKDSQPSIHKMETDLGKVFGYFADWTGKHGNEITKFFLTMLGPTEHFAQLIGAAAASLARIGEKGAPTAMKFFDAVRTQVLPIIEQVADTLNQNVVGGIGHALGGLLDFVREGMPALDNMLKPLGAIAHGFGTILELASDFVKFSQDHFGTIGGLISTYLSVVAVAASWSALRVQVKGVMALLASPVGIATRGAQNAQRGVVGFAKNPRRAMANATPVIISPSERERQANLRRVRANENFTGAILGGRMNPQTVNMLNSERVQPSPMPLPTTQFYRRATGITSEVPAAPIRVVRNRTSERRGPHYLESRRFEWYVTWHHAPCGCKERRREGNVKVHQEGIPWWTQESAHEREGWCGARYYWSARWQHRFRTSDPCRHCCDWRS